MAMKVATFSGCKVYNLSSGKALPQWLTEAKKRSLAKDADYTRRVELIQDFEMPTAVQCLKMTNDGEHIIATGTYPPSVRCYTLSDMAMKFQRGLTSEVVAFEPLSDDFGKMVFLQSDRSLNFHAPYGTHYSVRVPKFGRDLAYGWGSCDLYIGGSGDEVYRLNLELGQFREPFKLKYEGCNKVQINPAHQLLACGGSGAACEFFDMRAKKSVSSFSLLGDQIVEFSDPRKPAEITAMRFDSDGLTLGVGTSQGHTLLFDIRSKTPVIVKEHQYGEPIVDIYFHNSSQPKQIISTDKKLVKIWDRVTGTVMTNVETPADINNVLVVQDKRGDSGMLMLAGEQSRVMTYFIPQLGHAPRWCSFLESLTEELEESAHQTVYEDYKFITRQEVEELGASGLIGTPMLKGYMHGYFIEMKLFNKLRAVSKPFEYEEHRKRRIQERINEKRSSRIAPRKRVHNVGKSDALGNDEDEMIIGSASIAAGKGKGKGKDKDKASLALDDRFSSKLGRDEFQVDRESYDFKLRNPVTAKDPKSVGGSKRNRYDDDSEDDDLRDVYKL